MSAPGPPREPEIDINEFSTRVLYSESEAAAPSVGEIQGPDPAAATPVRIYGYDGSQASLLFSLDTCYGDGGLTHGVNAAAGIY